MCERRRGTGIKMVGDMESGMPAHGPCSYLLVLFGLNLRHSISLLLGTAPGSVPLYDLVSLAKPTP